MLCHADENDCFVVACSFRLEKCRCVRGLSHDEDDDMASGETVTGTGVQRMGKNEEADIRRESECAAIGNSWHSLINDKDMMSLERCLAGCGWPSCGEECCVLQKRTYGMPAFSRTFNLRHVRKAGTPQIIGY